MRFTTGLKKKFKKEFKKKLEQEFPPEVIEELIEKLEEIAPYKNKLKERLLKLQEIINLDEEINEITKHKDAMVITLQHIRRYKELLKEDNEDKIKEFKNTIKIPPQHTKLLDEEVKLGYKDLFNRY